MSLSFLSMWTLIDMAPANNRNGSIMFMSMKLKSKLSVMVYAISRNVGKKKPKIKITIESAIAKIIKPIVIGSLRNLKLTIEKNEASMSSMVVSSRMSSLLFSIKLYPWFSSSTKKLILLKNM